MNLLSLPETESQEIGQLRQLSDLDLKNYLQEALGDAGKAFIRAARAVLILEERGADLSDLSLGPLLGYLRKMAHGQLVPEVYANFRDYPWLLKRVAALPKPDQEKVLREPLEVACDQNGSVTFRMIEPARLSPNQVRQVFASDHIRTVDEQAAWARSQQKPLAQKSASPERTPYSIVGTRLVVYRPVTFTKRELQQILKAM